jgi:hypothetical protein
MFSNSFQLMLVKTSIMYQFQPAQLLTQTSLRCSSPWDTFAVTSSILLKPYDKPRPYRYASDKGGHPYLDIQSLSMSNPHKYYEPRMPERKRYDGKKTTISEGKSGIIDQVFKET